MLPDPIPAVLELMNAVSVFGTAKVQALLGRLSANEQANLATVLTAVGKEVFGYKVFGTALSPWALSAQAWMVLELQANRDLTTNPPSFTTPAANEIQQLVTRAAAMTRQAIMDDLSARLGGARKIEALATAMLDQTRRIALATWAPANFSQPLSHNPANFCYLVHGLRRETNIGLASAPPARLAYIQTNLAAYIGGSGEFRSGEYYLQNPGIIGKSLLSCSVLSAGKTSTYGSMYFGFILRVPIECIGAAQSSDMDMGFDKATRPDMLACEPDEKIRMAIITESFIDGVAALFMRALPSLTTLIASTAVTSHNEVAVIGSIGGLSVKIAGLFVKVGSGAMLPAEFDVDEKLWNIGQELRSCALRLGVPIVPLPAIVATGSAAFASQFSG